MVKEIKLEVDSARDDNVQVPPIFARFQFSSTKMTIRLGSDSHETTRNTSKLWSHTVYELENFAEGLRLISREGLPEFYEVFSRDTLIGPSVHLQPAIRFQLGHPGIGKEGRGVMFFCSTRPLRRADRRLIYLEAINGHYAECAAFETQTVIRFADELYQQAKQLAGRYISGPDVET